MAYDPLKRQFRTAGPRSFLPGDLKIVGGNITPSGTYNNSSTHVPNFDTFFAAWAAGTAWGEANGVKVQVDRAVTLGLNCVRLIGDVKGVLLGTVTRAAYLAAWTQLLDYCEGLGLYVYPTGYHTRGTGNWAQTAAEIAALAGLCAARRNVFGFDIINEIDDMIVAPDTASSLDAAVTNLQAITLIVSAVRAAAPDLPVAISCSSYGNISPGLIDARFEPLVDFWDGHTYEPPQPSGLVHKFDGWSTYFSHGKNKPVLCGEFGVPIVAGLINGTIGYIWTTSDRQAAYSNIRDFYHLQPHCMGSLAWALADQDSATNNEWGLYDASGTIRSDVCDILKTFPKSKRAPMRGVYPLASDTTIPASNYSNAVQITPTLGMQVGFPLNCKARLSAAIDVVTSPNVYDAVAHSYASTAYSGPEVPSRPQTGSAVGRYHLNAIWEGILSPGFHQFPFHIGHVSGATADGVVRASGANGPLTQVVFEVSAG